MSFEAIVQGGMVLIPPEVDLPDGTIVSVEIRHETSSRESRDAARSDEWRRCRLEDLRREIAVGVEQIERGECDDYDDVSLKELFERVKAEGRTRFLERQDSSAP